MNTASLNDYFESYETSGEGPKGKAHGKNSKASNGKWWLDLIKAWAQWNRNKNTNSNQKTIFRIPIKKVQLENIDKSKIVSTNSFEIRFNFRVEYGEKTRKSENAYLFLDLEIIAVLRFEVTKERLVYYVQECDVYLRKEDTNLPDSDLELGEISGPLKSSLCRIVRQITHLMNEKGKGSDYFIIDPSGTAVLVLDSISQNKPDCLELYFNLVVANSNVVSDQKHDSLQGNGISLLHYYLKHMFSPFVDDVTKLNKDLENKNIMISPETLEAIIHGIHETDSTTVLITVTKMPELNFNAERESTITIHLEGFSSNSHKTFFTVLFETKVKIELLIMDDKLHLQFREAGEPVIKSWESNIGTTGDLDYENLKILITQIDKGTIFPSLNDLNLLIKIPFYSLGSKLTENKENIQIC
ncbi:hypothetical protein GDO81_012856 [Engystomops pustulosus]|uniref:Uncharacterized protein n=2 Tax=Engystomops pustulosus TaxID=76066 RepID=A0AAV7B0Z8_ENGPU|nr:hypothetical protein GDO81_012856 [Engystomops pustulosus]